MKTDTYISNKPEDMGFQGLLPGPWAFHVGVKSTLL